MTLAHMRKNTMLEKSPGTAKMGQQTSPVRQIENQPNQQSKSSVKIEKCIAITVVCTAPMVKTTAPMTVMMNI